MFEGFTQHVQSEGVVTIGEEYFFPSGISTISRNCDYDYGIKHTKNIKNVLYLPK